MSESNVDAIAPRPFVRNEGEVEPQARVPHLFSGTLAERSVLHAKPDPTRW